MTVRGRGKWTVEGSAEDLFMLSRQLKAAGKVGLRKNIAKGVKVGTAPAAAAIRTYLRTEMPKGGGLNEWLASARITTSVLTGPKSAGVVLRDNKSGHDLKAINRTGKVRHPTRSGPNWMYENRQIWRDTVVDAKWWEHVLEGFDAPVRAALIEAMNATAREAGFRGR